MRSICKGPDPIIGGYSGNLVVGLTALHVVIPSLAWVILIVAFGTHWLNRLLNRLQQTGYEAISPSNEVGGITPVIIPLRTLRSTLILLLFNFITLTYFLDGMILVARAIITGVWEGRLPQGQYFEVYAVGGLAAFGGVYGRHGMARASSRSKGGMGGETILLS